MLMRTFQVANKIFPKALQGTLGVKYIDKDVYLWTEVSPGPLGLGLVRPRTRDKMRLKIIDSSAFKQIRRSSQSIGCSQSSQSNMAIMATVR